MKYGGIITALLFAFFVTGCVTKGTYEATVAELDKTKSSLSDAQNRIGLQNAQIDAQKKELQKNRQEIAKTKKELAARSMQRKMHWKQSIAIHRHS
ncbi:MAG: hypothetical protein FAF04_00260 [Epsilonproteobacteria bacterium]|nr:hypothetical protein [Campylobacterota bacterium]